MTPKPTVPPAAERVEPVVPLSVAISAVSHVARANYAEREREAQQWLRDAASPVAPPQEWRPISEAPRDGTNIIVGRAAIRLSDVAELPAYSCEAFWDNDEQGFMFPSAHGARLMKADRPTHFQPLPPPPKETTP